MGLEKKPCNCKAKQNADNLVTKIEDINKSKSQGYANKNKRLNKILYKTLKYLIYAILTFMVAIVILPFLLFRAISKKQIKIDLSKLLSWGEKK